MYAERISWLSSSGRAVFLTQSFDASAHIDDLGHSSVSLLLIGCCFCHVLSNGAMPHMSKPSFYFGSFHFNQVQPQKTFERDFWGRIATFIFKSTIGNVDFGLIYFEMLQFDLLCLKIGFICSPCYENLGVRSTDELYELR